MITLKNYAEQAAKIDFAKLSTALQDGHKYMVEFGDLYEDDTDIKSTIDTYLDKLNEAVGKQFLNEHIMVVKMPKAEAKKEQQKPAKMPKTARNKTKAEAKKKAKRETKEQVDARHTSAEQFIKDMERDAEKLKSLTEGQVIAIGLEFHKTFRATGAQTRDNTHDTKKRLSPTPENLIRWMKSPGHFDPIGVDTFQRTEPTANYKREISKQKFWNNIFGIKIKV